MPTSARRARRLARGPPAASRSPPSTPGFAERSCPAGGLGEGGDIEIPDVLDVVLDRKSARTRFHPGTHRGITESLERERQPFHLALAGCDLQRDIVRQLGEPARVADEQRLTERERAENGAR